VSDSTRYSGWRGLSGSEDKSGCVAELRQSCEEVLFRGIALALDLAGVSFIDRDGIALLHAQQDRDVVLRNASSFIDDLRR